VFICGKQVRTDTHNYSLLSSSDLDFSEKPIQLLRAVDEVRGGNHRCGGSRRACGIPDHVLAGVEVVVLWRQEFRHDAKQTLAVQEVQCPSLCGWEERWTSTSIRPTSSSLTIGTATVMCISACDWWNNR